MTVTLQLRDVLIRRGDRTIVQGVTFTAAAGEVLVLMGPSGAGKTSVLRAVAGLDPIAGGRITVARVGLVFQFHNLFEHLSALDNICLAPVHVLKQARADAERRARELLDALGVGHRAAALPSQLSGGEAQRVAVARALAVDPPVLLMDEPTASLDVERRRELATTVRQLAAGDGRTLLLATHDAEFARACADRILVLDAGTVTERPASRGEAPVE